jgi:hypothetical protein
MAVLVDSSATEAARLEAARTLVHAPSDATRQHIIALLDSPGDDQAPMLLLRALSEQFNPALRPALLAGAHPRAAGPKRAASPRSAP